MQSLARYGKCLAVVFVMAYWMAFALWREHLAAGHLSVMNISRMVGAGKGLDDVPRMASGRQRVQRQQYPADRERRLAEEVRETCVNKGLLTAQPSKAQTNLLFSHLLYDDKRRVVFCYVAKAGCSNWKRVFAVMKSGNDTSYKLSHTALHKRTNGHVNYLSGLPFLDALNKLQTYKKVMFVRNPVTRLLGVYRDLVAWRPKNASNAFMQSSFLRDRMRPLIGRSLKPDDVNITLTSFVKLVLSKRGVDEHWQTYTSNCMPCMVHYDYIGKHEGLPSSADDILEALNSRDIHFPRKELDYSDKPYRMDSSAAQYKKVSRTLLQQVWEQYREDMNLFNYDIPSDLGSEDGSPLIEEDTLEAYLQTHRTR